MRPQALVLVALTLAGCGWWGNKEKPRDAAGPGAGRSGQGAAASGTAGEASGAAGTMAAGSGTAIVPGSGWTDPEPPDAQARAEAVAAEEWNRARVTSLEMHITTLDRRVTGIEGFRTAVVADDTSLDDRLTRLQAEVTGTEITIRLPGSVLFDFDSATIRPDAERTLYEVSEVVKGYKARPVRVEGHTDSVASDEYNQKLSERRADAVRAWLAAHGAEKGRLTTRGHGETKPVADNTSVAGRQKNRRVEVIIAKGT
jgi:outer membrane protein OmpA-like peptidoglycan-associated protein